MEWVAIIAVISHNATQNNFWPITFRPIESSFGLRTIYRPQLMAINIIQGHREWRHDRKWKVWGRVEIKWHIWKWRAKAIGKDGWRVDGGSLRGCCFRLGTIKRTAAGKVKIVKAISIKATGTLIDFRSEQYVRLMCHPRQQQVTSLFSLLLLLSRLFVVPMLL